MRIVLLLTMLGEFFTNMVRVSHLKSYLFPFSNHVRCILTNMVRHHLFGVFEYVFS